MSSLWWHERALISYVVTSVLHLGIHGAIIGIISMEGIESNFDVSSFDDDEQVSMMQTTASLSSALFTGSNPKLSTHPDTSACRFGS